ncbi:MAG: hypothetical protein JNL25_15120 [Rhodospirillaceae bacterium]|nr:hypothetical protein [Rhodospirillaceae bacterium]
MTANAETTSTIDTVARQQDSAPSLQGYIDAIEPDRIYGWAWNSGDPSERLAVEIRQGEQLIVRLEANHPRPDLVANGIGDGRYAFVADIPAIGEINRASPITVLAIAADGISSLELKRQSGAPANTDSAAVLGEIRARDQRLQGQLRQLVSVAKERGGLDQGLHERMNEVLGRLDLALPEVDRRIGTLEVFELRFDTLLQRFETRLKIVEARSRTRQPLLLWLWAGLATTATLGFVAYHFLRVA